MTENTVTETPRDRWGRPLIVPPGGGDPVAYTRVSTLAKALDDLNNLMAWKQRTTAIGLLRRPDLLTHISGIVANGDPDTDWPTKRELNAVCEQAMEAAGGSRGRTAGTGFHSLTEAIDRGDEPLFVPEQDKPRLEAYRAAMAPYEPLEIEQFVVCDEVQAAGTFDRLVLCPDGRVRVADLKTGKSEADYPLATAMQLSVYAHGKRYDPESGNRADLDDRLDLTTGLLVHMPPSGGCRIIPLDLVKGWAAAETAHRVHHHVRKWKADDLIVGGDLAGGAA
jgi:hypothetical protein